MSSDPFQKPISEKPSLSTSDSRSKSTAADFSPKRRDRSLLATILAASLILASGLPCWAGSLPIKMQLLVISAKETDPGYIAMIDFLDYIGVPCKSLIATKQNLTAEMLADAFGGKYQGIILITDNLNSQEGGTFNSVFTASEWQALGAYENAFQVRQVTYLTSPDPLYSLAIPEAIAMKEQTSLYLSLTASGIKTFSYLKADAHIPLQGAPTYAFQPQRATSSESLVEDQSGNVILSVQTYADGRENLTVACDNRRHLLHSQLLSYGIIDWVTRGLHIGERTVYLAPQVDDIFLSNQLFDADQGVPSERLQYRLNTSDMLAVENWQSSVRNLRNPSFERFSLTMAFNGGAAQGNTDPLVQYFASRQDRYNWVNHTFRHLDLNSTDYSNSLLDYQLNHQFALALPFSRYRSESLVSGAISGLTNPQAMRAMADFGIKYIVSDASRPEQNNPRPNIGIYNALQPSILEIPRHPTNIYVSASTIEEEVGQYNAIYRSYWGRDLSYPEILDLESAPILSYMISYDMDPLMFHQSNLRNYDGLHSLLGDLIDTTIRKYSQYMNLPVLSPRQDELGKRMAQRTAIQAAGIEAELIPGSGIWLRASRTAVISISGISVGNPAEIDTCSAGTYRIYGGKPTSWLQIDAGQWHWIPFAGGKGGKSSPQITVK